MTTVKCVIGANFGDEGKGLMTDFFAEQARACQESCLVVLSNGGAQRGHTVRDELGRSHVFRHFGSGTLAGAHTYLPKEYIVNPIVFRQEFENLKDEWGVVPVVSIHGDNLCTTPYDSMLNMMIEDNRGNDRHGSCGAGIWETLVRDGLRIGDLKKLSLESLHNYLVYIRDNYVFERLENLGMEVPENWKGLLESDMILDRYISDLAFIIENCKWVNSEQELFAGYDTVVFENGQGLLLDQDIEGYGEHTTPSSTGVKIPAWYINKYCKNADIEICYVTRSYMTRHGAGRFDTECKKEDLNGYMLDLTNVPNTYQGELRYGYLDMDEMLERCRKDFERLKDLLGDARLSVAVTHLDDYNKNISLDAKEIKYKSIGPCWIDVEKI